MKIWIDITNTPQVHFLCAIARNLNKSNFSYHYSARNFSETLGLLQTNGIQDYVIFGKHHGRGKINKAIGLLTRFKEIYNSGIDYDISLSCGSDGAIWTSWLKRKTSIAFGDNDLAKQWTYGRFVDFAFFPDAIPEKVLTRQGLKKNRLFLYPGYKEDIYLADYVPDPDFIGKLPFNDYVVVRPENIMANYIKSQVQTITPELLRKLDSKGINILYLPRYETDQLYCQNLKHVFVPETSLNGLDAVYFSNGVFTGAGTLAREAACLGVPSFSFFAGDDLLAVDKCLIQQKKMFFSRSPEELILASLKSEKTQANFERSKIVRDMVIRKLEQVLIQN